MRFFRRRWRSGPLLQDATTNNFALGTVSDADLYALRLETLSSTQGELNALAQATSNIKMSSIAAATFAASGVGALSGALRTTSEGVLSSAATSSMAAAGTTGQILYVGGTSANKVGITGTSAAISLTALTGGIAAAPIEGDIIIAMYVVGSAGDTTLAITDGTTPYTLIDSELFADGSASDANLRVAYKVVGSTPDTTVTFGPTNNATWAGAMVVQVWRNVDGVNPIEVVANAVGTGSSRPDGPSITPTTTGAVVVVAGGGATATAAALVATGFNHFQTTSGADTIDAVAGMGATYWTSGTYDPPAWTGGTAVAGDSWAALTFALKPVTLGIVETAMVSNATGAVNGVGRSTAESVLTATPVGAFTAKGSLAAVTYKGAQQGNLIAPGSPATITLNGADLVGPGGSIAPAQDDLIVAIIAYGFQSDIPISVKDQETNTEYTVLDTEKYINGSTNDVNFKVAYFRKTTSTATTQAIVTATGAETGQAIVWFDIYSGTDPVQPVDLLAFASGTGTTRPTIPDLQTTRQGSLLVISAAGAQGSSTVWTGHGLTNYRDGAEISGSTNQIQASRGHKVIATDTVFAGRTWGGGATPAAGYSWAAFGYQINGYVPDNGAASLDAPASASASFSATSTGAGKLEAYAPGVADFVAEELSGTASDFAASAAGSFAAAGVAVQNSVLAASALGSGSFAGIQIVHAAASGAAPGALSAAGGATIGVAFAATASGAASFAGQGFGVGVMSAAATGVASWTGRVVGTAVFAAAASGQLSGAGGALAPATLTSNALGAADLRATAITQAQLQAAGNGFANHITAATAASAFETAAAGSADFWIDTVAEAVLLTGGTGSFDAHGAYGGSASAGDRIIYIDAPIRKVTFSRADVRMITLDRHDRIIYVGPEVRNVGGG